MVDKVVVMVELYMEEKVVVIYMEDTVVAIVEGTEEALVETEEVMIFLVTV